MDRSTDLTWQRAKTLRHNQTPAEQKLWGALRNRTLDGFKFRRQVPLGPFIADFVCPAACLIVEVDGATHGDAREIFHDTKRTAYLMSRGYRVHRVDNEQIYNHIADVLDGIHAVLMEQMRSK
jgi:very-short-patch-repair endonuclease